MGLCGCLTFLKASDSPSLQTILVGWCTCIQHCDSPLHDVSWGIMVVGCLALGVVLAGIVVLEEVNDSDILVLGVAIPVL